MSSKHLLVLFLIGVVVLATTGSLVDHNHKPLKGKGEKLPPKHKPPHGHLLVEEANYNEEDSHKGHEKPPPKHKPPHHPGRMLLEEVSKKVDDFHRTPDSKGEIPPYGYKPPYGYQPPYGYKPPYGRQPPYGYHPPPHGHGLLEEEDFYKPRKGKDKKPPPKHKPPHGNQYLEEEVEGEGEGEGYTHTSPRKTEPTYGHHHGHDYGRKPPPLN